jgi:Protein of unknown function (DUF2783)
VISEQSPIHDAVPIFSTDCRLPDPDACFALLTDACRDLDATQGHLLHAQLVLLLANHIGDPRVLRGAIGVAREALDLPAVAPAA